MRITTHQPHKLNAKSRRWLRRLEKRILNDNQFITVIGYNTVLYGHQCNSHQEESVPSRPLKRIDNMGVTKDLRDNEKPNETKDEERS